MLVFIGYVSVSAILALGCSTRRYMADARHPEVVVTEHDQLEFCGEKVDVEDLPGLLEDAGYTKEDTINIRVPADIRDFRLPYYIMGILAKNGFRRPVLVKERRAYTTTGAGARAAATPGDRTVDGLLKKRTVPQQRVTYPRR